MSLRSKVIIEVQRYTFMDGQGGSFESIQLESSMYALMFFLLIATGLQASVVEGISLPGSEGINDATALLQFKGNLQRDPSNYLSGWGSNSSGGHQSTDPCTWDGVNCTSSRVTTVDLSWTGLVGDTVSISELGGLDMLQSLSLAGNKFSGNLSTLRLSSRGNCSLKHLDLSSNSLKGSIPGDVFGGCWGIQFLNLSGNILQDEIPKGVFGGNGALAIQTLDLSHNNIWGSGLIADLVSNCSSLEYMDLSVNNFSGSIPKGFGVCSELTQLALASNNLTGSIPSDLFTGNCSDAEQKLCPTPTGQLRALNLSLNQLTGPLPVSGYCSPVLLSVDISFNNLTGPVPSTLGNCSGLTFLKVSHNSLTGESIPQLPYGLQELDLSMNNLTGNFPPSLVHCLSLQVLDLSSNLLGGEIPDDVGKLQALEVLILGNNSFEGPFPLAVSNCSNLRFLDLSSNLFYGDIPVGLCPVSSKLQSLLLPDNNFSGMIPPQLSNCTQLITLDLSFNYITGTIPPELGNLANLESLMLWFNHVEGTIPANLGGLPKLKHLILNNNHLRGGIPPQLSNCTLLEWLSVASNALTGTIPPEIFTLKRLGVLQLGDNSLSGSIPLEISNCSNLFWLDLYFNHLTGQIPTRLGRNGGVVNGTLMGVLVAFVGNIDPSCAGLGGLVDLAGIRIKDMPRLGSCRRTRLYYGENVDWHDEPTVTYIDLSYNNLQGSIPLGIGDYMHSLHVLDLAHNNLSGPMPSNLGNCADLLVLDLSSNSLVGSIPDSFTNLTQLAVLNFSSNQLSGPIPQGGQLTAQPASVYANNPGLCGQPLPTSCKGVHNQSDSPAAATSRNQHKGRAVRILNQNYLALLLSGIALVVLMLLLGVVRSIKARHSHGSRLEETESADSSSLGAWKDDDLRINVASFEAAGPLKKLTFGHLLQATNNFSSECIVGVGGFGEVYRAHLRDGSVVAVKKLVYLTYEGEREFTSEMETLGRVEHDNLVALLGYCNVKEERLLVYEYMPCGSLEKMLHRDRSMPEKGLGGHMSLTWKLRKQIAIGAARGLAFLHHSCVPHIIHRDFKSSNVLLDKNLEARVSDFGMARLMSAEDTHLSVSTLAGTPGYVPPEYYQSFRCTRQGDVYSYGVVLLELISGRRPTDKEEFGDSNLVGWTKLKIREHMAQDVVDRDLRGMGYDDEILGYLQIACACLEDQPSQRPNMLHVVATLKEIADLGPDR